MIYFLTRNLKGWYYNLKFKRVIEIIKKVKEINAKWDTNAIYRRVCIPKPNGKIRPSGVPDLEWRVSLAMVTYILDRIIEPTIGEYQHGFRRNKSIFSAWEKIFEKIIDEKKKVYEFDFVACFNRISSRDAIWCLYQMGIPMNFLVYLYSLTTIAPVIDSNDIKEEEEMKQD